MQTHPFQFNRQVLLFVLLAGVALALPLGMVVVGLMPSARPSNSGEVAKRPEEPTREPQEFREKLEKLAQEKLSPLPLESPYLEWKIMVPEPERAIRYAEEFARELGGTALINTPNRLVASLAPEKIEEFVRRIAVMTGAAVPEHVPSPVLSLEFVSQTSDVEP